MAYRGGRNEHLKKIKFPSGENPELSKKKTKKKDFSSGENAELSKFPPPPLTASNRSKYIALAA